MNRIIIAVLMLLTGMSAVYAADIQRRSLVINTKGGETVEFRFTMDPVMTFSGADLVLTDINDDTVTMPMSNVASITFTDDTTGVAAIGASAVRFTLRDGRLVAEGLEAGSTLTLHDLKGALLVAVRADKDGRAEVAVKELATGVYAVSAAGHSFKFIK